MPRDSLANGKKGHEDPTEKCQAKAQSTEATGISRIRHVPSVHGDATRYSQSQPRRHRASHHTGGKGTRVYYAWSDQAATGLDSDGGKGGAGGGSSLPNGRRNHVVLS